MKRNSDEWTTLNIRLPKSLDKKIIDEAINTSLSDTKTSIVLKILEKHYRDKKEGE